LNLYKFYDFIKNLSQTPNTPAVHLFFALEQALDNILNEGVSTRYANIKQKARFLRQGMLDLGLKFLIDQKDMCSVLTTVHIPSHIDVALFRKKLREKSIIIYEGKGCFKNKVFQVGNIGELSFDDLQYFLSSVGEILHSFNHVSVKKRFLVNKNILLLTHRKENKKSTPRIMGNSTLIKKQADAVLPKTQLN